MSKNYTRDQIKISVVKILHTLGWNSINSTPLEMLTDLLGNYIYQITKSTISYTNEFGQTQPNLDHLGLTFRDMGISITELKEYVKYVNFGLAPNNVPKYPLPKEDHLNFLKPGSKEVVTRPVHIHEHLPPMISLFEANEHNSESDGFAGKMEQDFDESNLDIFKKPDLPTVNKSNIRREEEGSRPTREISSVMMTTSGFLSPAREGKLPESRTPAGALDPIINSNNTNSDIIDKEKPVKPKVVKKVEKKKDKVIKDGFKVNNEEKKKMQSMKCLLKNKQSKPIQNVLNSFMPNNDLKISPIANNNKLNNQNKLNKALAAARLKTEKLNTTITPITVKSTNVDKLFSEPDKKKVNIFKKISNVKNELKSRKDERESRESSPDLIIDEPDEVVSKLSHLPSDITIEPINTRVKTPEKADNPYFDDDIDEHLESSSAPKTPEMISQSPPPLIKEKRKRKEGKKLKKITKYQSPHRENNTTIDIDLERPKTPEAQVIPKIDLPLQMAVNNSCSIPTMPNIPFPFLANFGGPGLIPTNPLFTPLPFSPINLPKHLNYVSSLNSAVNLPTTNNNQQLKVDELNSNEKSISSDKPSSISESEISSPSLKNEKKNKEHKKDKKDKLKKRNKKEKIKNKAEKKKLKEEKKIKIKKEKREKRKEKDLLKEDESQSVKITLKIKSPSPRPETPEKRKLNIKPIIKKIDDVSYNGNNGENKRETSPGLAKISALVTGPPKPKIVNHTTPIINNNHLADEVIQEEKYPIEKPHIRITGAGPGRPRIHPIKPKPTNNKLCKKRRPSVKKDADGNEVWICPACGRQDDGSPMIGCDGCDAWYHWVCVGIQVPPDDNEDWYCRHCLLKKNEDLQSERKDLQKKKRKKREKKDY